MEREKERERGRDTQNGQHRRERGEKGKDIEKETGRERERGGGGNEMRKDGRKKQLAEIINISKYYYGTKCTVDCLFIPLHNISIQRVIKV